jgi:hypothetical protein
MQSLCDVCRRQQGAGNVALFIWNLSQRENPRVVSGGGVREEVCTLYRWGTQLAPERDSCWFWAG